VSPEYLYTSKLSFSARLAENPDPSLFLSRDMKMIQYSSAGIVSTIPRRGAKPESPSNYPRFGHIDLGARATTTESRSFLEGEKNDNGVATRWKVKKRRAER